jgi:predicted transcriptional regulator
MFYSVKYAHGETVSITLPPDLLIKAQAFAQREHRTMSELFREALRRYMGGDAEWDALLKRTRAKGESGSRRRVSCMGGRSMERTTASAAHLRAGPDRGGIFVTARGPRYRFSLYSAGERSDSDRDRRRTGAGRPASADAPIPKPAHVIGQRLPCQAFRDSPCGRGSYTRRRFQNLPQARQ